MVQLQGKGHYSESCSFGVMPLLNQKLVGMMAPDRQVLVLYMVLLFALLGVTDLLQYNLMLLSGVGNILAVKCYIHFVCLKQIITVLFKIYKILSYLVTVRHQVLQYRHIALLILNLLNFLNGIIHLPCLELSIIIFRDIKMRT